MLIAVLCLLVVLNPTVAMLPLISSDCFVFLLNVDWSPLTCDLEGFIET